MVARGIIDCLYTNSAGAVLIDWKTDALSADALNERVEMYRPQLEIYALAVTARLGLPVASRQLVFLTPRRIIDV